MGAALGRAMAALLAGAALAGVAPGIGAAQPVRATPLGAVDVAGSVMHVRIDDAGARLAIATVRYPEGGLRRDELHCHELGGAGSPPTPVHRLTRDIDDVEAAALSRDGERVAVSCGPDVCILRWGAEAIESRLAAGARRGAIGALAFRPDHGLLVAAQREHKRIVAWDLPQTAAREWAVAGVGERMREAVTPRLHGGPPWVPRWVGISPDGGRIAAIRDDGTVSVWTRAGTAVTSLPGPYHADMDPAFAPDGALLALHPGNGRIAAVDVDTGRVVLAVEDRPSRSVRRAALLLAGRAGYLAVAGSDAVALHAVPSGALAASIPVAEPVWRMAISGDGRLLAVATQHRVTLWRLAPEP